MRELRWIRLRLGETAWGAAPGGSMDDTSNAGLFELVGHKVSDRTSDERRKIEDHKSEIGGAKEPEIPTR